MGWFCFCFQAEEKKADGGTDDERITVVLKVNMHCDGCAKKVKRSVTGFKGVESVTVDNSNNKLTVVGKLNPEKIRSSVENKMKTKVELVSPLSTNDTSRENKEGSGRVRENDQANGELIYVDPNKYDGNYTSSAYSYPIENEHHPSNFSHENSNVCSVMRGEGGGV